jgi:hypothetical protein
MFRIVMLFFHQQYFKMSLSIIKDYSVVGFLFRCGHKGLICLYARCLDFFFCKCRLYKSDILSMEKIWLTRIMGYFRSVNLLQYSSYCIGVAIKA